MEEDNLPSLKGTIDQDPVDDKIGNVSLSQFSQKSSKKPQTSVNRTRDEAMDILQSDIEQDDTIKEATQAEEDPGRNSP